MTSSGSRAGLALALVPSLVLSLLLAACGGGLGSEDPGSRTIAFLRAVPSTGETTTEPMILEELRAAGFVVGRNLRVLAAEPEEAYPDPAQAAAAVARWRREGVELIIALSSAGATIVRDTAPDIPVLFLSVDPSSTGLVQDEARPGGRLTGVTFRVPADSTLDLAARVIGGIERAGLIYPEDEPAALAHLEAVRQAGQRLGVEVVDASFASEAEVARAARELEAAGVEVVLLSTSPAAVRALSATGAALAGTGIPVVANTHLADFALLALYPDYSELGRQLGRQAARLLSGSSAAAIPVEDPRRFQSVLDLSMARALGITVPEEVLHEVTTVRP